MATEQPDSPKPNIWARFWGSSWWLKGPVIGIAAVFVLSIIGAAIGNDEEGATPASADQSSTATATADSDDDPDEEEPTNTPEPTDTPEPSNTPEPTNTPTPQPTPTVRPAVGVSIEEGGSIYTVNEVVDPYVPSNQFLQADAGNRYFTFDVSQQAVGELDAANPLYFSIQDTEDFVYDCGGFGAPDPSFSSGDLNPGQTRRGWIACELPDDAVVVLIQVEAEIFGPNIPIVFMQ